MSDAAVGAQQSAVISLAEVERRVTLVREPSRLDVQGQLDWGQALLASGDVASARLLVKGAWIHQGFSPELESRRADLATALGMGQRERASATADRPGGNTIDLALGELRAFAERFGQRIVADARATWRPAAVKPGLHPTAAVARGASLPSERGVAELVDDAFSWLVPEAGADTDRAGIAAIVALRGSERDPQHWSAAGLAGAPAPLLANAIVVQELRAFLRSQSDLLLPRVGHPELFQATARFSSMGLGPYFGNVGQIVRSSVNLFELAIIAAEAAGTGGDPIAVEAWVALLARDLAGWLRYDIVDELGDRNASFALTVILERTVAVAASDVDRSLVGRIRDAALDNLDYDLAAQAQQKLLDLSGNDWLERRILGSIYASAGLIAAADQLLSSCLNDHPGDVALAREVEANRERRHAPFALVKGYGSPQDRQLKRLAARGVAA